MKIAVVGAGAIGGYVGGWLAAAGEDVTFIARGANLDAIRKCGMRVIGEDGLEVIAGTVAAHQNTADAGAQDVVVLAVKAHQVAAIAAKPRAALRRRDDDRHDAERHPVVVLPQTGRPVRRTPVHAADPDGSIAKTIDPNRILGSVVYPAAVLESPGVVRVVEGKRFTLGEPDGSTSPRAQAISAAFTRAGFKAPITDDIRGEIWLKVWGNLSFNPISALSHATLVDLLQFPLTRQLSIDMMREAEAIAGKLGVTFRVGIDKRIAGAEKVGAHKTSMLQDVEAGRADRARGAGRRHRRARSSDGDADAAHRRGVRVRESPGEDARRPARATGRR